MNCIATSPSDGLYFIIGGADCLVSLWDDRMWTSAKSCSSTADGGAMNPLAHSFVSHSDDIIQLAWSPHEETVFASASADRRINIWDAGIIEQNKILKIMRTVLQN